MFIPVALIGLRETYGPVILERKAARLRKQTGNKALRSKLQGGVSLRQRFQVAIVRPLKLLVTVPIITLMSLYVSVVYGIMYLLFTTFPTVYEGQYEFSAGTSGLSYLPVGIGMLVGIIILGVFSDRLVKVNQDKGHRPRPELRLSPLFTVPCGIAIPAGLFIYGWTTDAQVHWIASMIGVALFGVGILTVMVSSARIKNTRD